MSGFRWQGLSLTSALRTHWVPREAPESGLWDPQFIPWAFLKDPSSFQACKKRSACKDSNRSNSIPPLPPSFLKKKKKNNNEESEMLDFSQSVISVAGATKIKTVYKNPHCLSAAEVNAEGD